MHISKHVSKHASKHVSKQESVQASAQESAQASAQVIVPRCKPFNARLIQFLRSTLDMQWGKPLHYKDVMTPAGLFYPMHVQPIPDIVQLQQNFELIPEKFFTRIGYNKQRFVVIKDMTAHAALHWIEQNL